MALEIGIASQEPAGRRVTLHGRLDTLTTPQLEAEIAALLAALEVRAIVFQLDELEYLEQRWHSLLDPDGQGAGRSRRRRSRPQPAGLSPPGAGHCQGATVRADLRQRGRARRLPRRHPAHGPRPAMRQEVDSPTSPTDDEIAAVLGQIHVCRRCCAVAFSCLTTMMVASKVLDDVSPKTRQLFAAAMATEDLEELHTLMRQTLSCARRSSRNSWRW